MLRDCEVAARRSRYWLQYLQQARRRELTCEHGNHVLAPPPRCRECNDRKRGRGLYRACLGPLRRPLLPGRHYDR